MNEQTAPHLMNLNRVDLLRVIFAYLTEATMIHANIYINAIQHHMK